MKFLSEFKSRFRILKKGNISLVVSGMLFTFASAADISNTVIVNSASAGTNGTKALLSHNGTPMVNIAKPTGTGLSKNYYDKFNVDSKGLVLNNMTAVGQTQLAGYELPNLNLGIGKRAVAATTILNEVKSTAPTTFEGYIEVGGNKAAVIIANPNGISVNGGGFINASRTSLITGSSNLNEAGDAISSFNVGENRISISGTGLDAKDTTVLDLVAKSISIDGQINAKLLNLMAGVNSYDYENHGGTTSNTTASTEYAIDASALGSMYANAITIKATNQGLGVKISSDSGAMAGDFTIDSTGKVVIGGKISAAKNTDVTADVPATATTPATTKIEKASEVDGEGNIKITTQNRDADGFKLDKGSLSAEGNVEFKTGGFTLEGGLVKASNDFKVDASSLTDIKETSTAEGVNIRSADNNIDIKLTGTHTVGNDISYVANKSITLNTVNANISGTVYAKENLSITTSGEFASGVTGSIVTDKVLSFNAGSVNNGGKITTNSTSEILNLISAGNFTNSGNIVGPNGITISATNLTNSGEITNTLGDVSITATSITNSNLLKSTNALTLSSSNISNSSNTAEISGKTITLSGTTILSNAGNLFTTQGDISLIGANSITNSGIIKSAGDLTLKASTFNTTAGSINASKNISLEGTTSFTNGGNIINEDNQSDINITAGSFTNSSNIVSSKDLIIVTAGAVSNSGLVKGTNNLSLTGASTIDNTSTGIFTATNALTLSGSGAFTNAGKIFNENDTSDVSITSGNFTNSLNIVSAHDLIISTSGAVSNSGLTLGTNNLSLTGATTINNSSTGAFVASELLTLSGSGALSNAGTIYSKDLALTASSITNSATTSAGGGITAEGTMTSNGSFLNSGDTWIKNGVMNGGTFENSGTFQAQNSLAMTFGTSWKNTSNVFAGGNVTIDTADFSNGAGASTGGGALLNLTFPGERYMVFNTNPIQYVAGPTNGVPTGFTLQQIYDNPNILQGTTLTSPSGTPMYYYPVPFQEGFNSPDPYFIGNAFRNGFYLNAKSFNNFSVPASISTYIIIGPDPSSTPTVSVSATLGSNGTVTIRNFTTGSNNAGTISGNTVNISGQSGSTFTNQAISSGSKKITYSGTYNLPGSLTLGSVQSTESVGGGSIGGVIKANSLNATGFSLSNVGFTASTIGSNSAKPTAGTNSVGLVGSSTITPKTPNSLGINLPSNPNGKFVVSANPQSQFLVESNPTYGSKAKYLGSDYLMKALGIDPAMQKVKLLGDAAYEAKMIEQQITKKTGQSLLSGMADAGTQIKAMYDNAAFQAGTLGLKFGEAPTATQLANLKSDMVWMVKTVVNGVEVLAPQVYLAKSTLDALAMNEEGGTITAKNANLNLDSLNNEGGTIKGDNLNVTSKGDITNTSGTITGGNVKVNSTDGKIVNQSNFANTKTATISGENLDLSAKGDIVNSSSTISGGNVNVESKEGSIVNETKTQTIGEGDNQSTKIGRTATIESTKDLSLKANKDIKVIGADVKAGGNATLDAKENIVVDTIQDVTKTKKTYETTTNDSVTETTQTTLNVKNIGSNIDVGKNLKVNSGKDTTIAGSNVKAGENVDVNAGGNLNIIDRQDVSKSSTSQKKDEIGFDVSLDSGGLKAGVTAKNTQETSTNTYTTSKGSSIQSGANTKLNAQNDMNIRGSSVDAQGNLDMNAKNISVTAGENTSTQENDIATKKVSLGVEVTSEGAMGTAKYNQKDQNETFNKSNAVTSSLKSGGNLTRTASEKLTDEGTQINAKGDISQSADTIESLAAKNTSSKTTQSSEVEVGGKIGVTLGGNGKVSTSVSTKSSQSDEASSKAVVSNINSGGNVTSSSKNKTTLEGTNIEAAKDVTINAKDLDVKAAADTTTSSSKADSLNVDASVEAGSSGVQGASVNVSKASDKSQGNSSTAVTSTIKSGGNLNVNTKGDASFEGTNLESKANTNINAGGDVSMKAARDTSNFSSNSNSVSVGVGYDAGGEKANSSQSLSVGVGVNSQNEKSNQAVTGSIQSGGNINIKSGKDVTLEGVDVNADGKTKISASGDVNLKTAESSYESSEVGVNAGATLTTGGGRKGEALPDTKNLQGFDKVKQTVSNTIQDKKDGVKSSGVSPVGLGVSAGYTDKKTIDATKINSKNGIEIEAGGSVNNEQEIKREYSGITPKENLDGGESGVTINAAGGINNTEKLDQDISISGGFSAGKDASREGVSGNK